MCMRRRIVLQDQGLGRVPRLPQHLQSCTVPVVLQPIFLGVRDPSRSGMLRSQSGIQSHRLRIVQAIPLRMSIRMLSGNLELEVRYSAI